MESVLWNRSQIILITQTRYLLHKSISRYKIILTRKHISKWKSTLFIEKMLQSMKIRPYKRKCTQKRLHPGKAAFVDILITITDTQNNEADIKRDGFLVRKRSDKEEKMANMGQAKVANMG